MEQNQVEKGELLLGCVEFRSIENRWETIIVGKKILIYQITKFSIYNLYMCIYPVNLLIDVKRKGIERKSVKKQVKNDF